MQWQQFFLDEYNKFINKRILPNIQHFKIDFCTNDYLGFNSIPALQNTIKNQLIQDLKFNNIGSTGSRLLSGNSLAHTRLEKLIAATKQSENALVFSSGYQANFGVLSALLSKIPKHKLKVFSDKLNHASLHSACNTLQIKQIRFEHNNLEHLEQRITSSIQDDSYIVIVTESIFGMDGDILDINNLVKLAKKYNAFLYIDEAHATGLYGKNGYGLTCEIFDKYENIVSMGTFSKALGASGGYIACSTNIKNYLINTCSSFIYSTAPSPILMQSIYNSWQLLPQLGDSRLHVENLSQILRAQLINLGFNIGSSNSHIIPIIFDSLEQSQDLYNYLLHNNVKTCHIRPPTVPNNAPRIRISVCANHTIENINLLCELLSIYQS